MMEAFIFAVAIAITAVIFIVSMIEPQRRLGLGAEPAKPDTASRLAQIQTERADIQAARRKAIAQKKSRSHYDAQLRALMVEQLTIEGRR